VVSHNNGCTGINQRTKYSRGLKMTQQKQMIGKSSAQNVEFSDEELNAVAGGLNMRRNVNRPENWAENKFIMINKTLGMAG